MGLSVYASLAVGAKLEFQPSTSLETRYNERTGDPYQIEVESGGRYVILGTDITVEVLNYGDEEDGGDRAIPHDDYGDSDRLSFIAGDIVGLIVSQAKNDRDVEVAGTSSAELANVTDSVRQQLSERFGYTGDISVFLIKELSY